MGFYLTIRGDDIVSNHRARNIVKFMKFCLPDKKKTLR